MVFKTVTNLLFSKLNQELNPILPQFLLTVQSWTKQHSIRSKMVDGEQTSKGFDFWLKKLCISFIALTDLQKNTTIEHLLQICGPEQLRYLSTKLETLVKRDFFQCLPLELSFHVLKWLDSVSLLRCCLVSKSWNKVISSCNDVWERACREIGVKVEDESEDISWKTVYLGVVHQMNRLKSPDAFQTSLFYGHTARVFALFYRNNLLATGSDDRTVRIWDLQTGHCKSVLTTHTCADVSFDDKKVITASFDNTIGLWELESGQRLQCYQGHTGAVFCVDFSDELGVIVSGSADTTVKIWDMASGLCHVTRYGHTDWVTKVILKKSEVDSVTHRRGEFVLLSMDKRAVKIWSLDPRESTCLSTLAHHDHNVTFQPRLQFDGHLIACASDEGVHVWNFQTLQLTRVLTSSSPAKWLVAYGQMVSLLLDMNNLYIYNTKTENCIAHCVLPPFRKSVRGSNFTPGDIGWLDGLHTEPRSTLVLATSMPDHSIFLLKLKDVT